MNPIITLSPSGGSATSSATLDFRQKALSGAPIGVPEDVQQAFANRTEAIEKIALSVTAEALAQPGAHATIQKQLDTAVQGLLKLANPTLVEVRLFGVPTRDDEQFAYVAALYRTAVHAMQALPAHVATVLGQAREAAQDATTAQIREVNQLLATNSTAAPGVVAELAADGSNWEGLRRAINQTDPIKIAFTADELKQQVIAMLPQIEALANKLSFLRQFPEIKLGDGYAGVLAPFTAGFPKTEVEKLSQVGALLRTLGAKADLQKKPEEALTECQKFSFGFGPSAEVYSVRLKGEIIEAARRSIAAQIPPDAVKLAEITACNKDRELLGQLFPRSAAMVARIDQTLAALRKYYKSVNMSECYEGTVGLEKMAISCQEYIPASVMKLLLGEMPTPDRWQSGRWEIPDEHWAATIKRWDAEEKMSQYDAINLERMLTNSVEPRDGYGVVRVVGLADIEKRLADGQVQRSVCSFCDALEQAIEQGNAARILLKLGSPGDAKMLQAIRGSSDLQEIVDSPPLEGEGTVSVHGQRVAAALRVREIFPAGEDRAKLQKDVWTDPQRLYAIPPIGHIVRCLEQSEYLATLAEPTAEGVRRVMALERVKPGVGESKELQSVSRKHWETEHAAFNERAKLKELIARNIYGNELRALKLVARSAPADGEPAWDLQTAGGIDHWNIRNEAEKKFSSLAAQVTQVIVALEAIEGIKGLFSGRAKEKARIAIEQGAWTALQREAAGHERFAATLFGKTPLANLVELPAVAQLPALIRSLRELPEQWRRDAATHSCQADRVAEVIAEVLSVCNNTAGSIAEAFKSAIDRAGETRAQAQVALGLVNDRRLELDQVREQVLPAALFVSATGLAIPQ